MSELFPPTLLEEMIHDYLHNPLSQDLWFTCDGDDQPDGIAFCQAEKFTEGTFNLRAIAVRPDARGAGVGSRMVTFIEEELRARGGRLLIVETSGTDDFASTRRFYQKLGYRQAATLADFWADGDDKVIFRKKLRR
ncbi:MAG: GNAT family N-acetyltransferase [Catalinimonas sp.]